MIALIDYKAGNLTSVKKALATVGADVFVPASAAELANARGIIVPGVGHFGATRALGREWVDAIRRHIDAGKPLLGICLGMQWLFEGSDEAPGLPGLGLLAGRCYRLGGRVRFNKVRLKPDPTDETTTDETTTDETTTDETTTDERTTDETATGQKAATVKVPHVGWNSLAIDRDASIVDRVQRGAQVYFTHSFVAPLTGDTVAETEHGERFASIVQRGRVAGVQFHPEKSGDVGLRVLANFLHLADSER